jgi:hypothetical protein
MSLQPPIPAELWDQIPPAAQAAIMTLVQQYERQLQALPCKNRSMNFSSAST